MFWILIKQDRALDSKTYIIERRSGQDRRNRALPGLRYMWGSGRRLNLRRKSDRARPAILDWYTESLFAGIIGVLCMSLLDAALTLILINNGAVELNPVMAYFLSYGQSVFIGAKYIFTSCSVVIVLLCSHVFLRRPGIYLRSLLNVFMGSFGLVIAWECFLVFKYVL